MRFSDAVRLAAVNIFQTPLRSALTVLGLAIGIGAILTVLTLGNAGQEQVEMEMTRMGVDKVWITATKSSSRALEESDSALLFEATGAPATAQTRVFLPVSAQGVQAYAQISGCDNTLTQVQKLSLLQGRFLNAWDQRDGAAVALIDENLSKALFEDKADDCVGLKVAVGGRLYRIVGRIGNWTTQIVTGTDGTLYLPMATFIDAFGQNISEIMLAVPKNTSGNDLGKQAVEVLTQEGGSYQAATLQAEIEAAREVVRIFVMVLCCVAVICMLVGGIGVMNILLVSVRERRREIGVMKALGATGAQVCLLFVLEAAAYAALGGILGVAAGEMMVRFTGGWIGLHAAIEPALVPMAVGFAALVGVFFGVAPAWRAARMEPVEALRQP